jgi:peptidoglycan/LPS O-acetylase OafA/YrhL
MKTVEERIPELDGIRGIAILVVMAFHILSHAEHFFNSPLAKFFYSITQMGWAGVDMFFVLSGYLITNILLEKKGGKHYFRNFYMRRILRIFPVYYLSLTIIFVGGFYNRAQMGESVFVTGLWFYSYLQNWLFASGSGPALYFVHFWSLAIEEQFYLVWPLVVYFADRKLLTKIGSIAIVGALLLRIYIVFLLDRPDIVNVLPQYTTVTRMDSLLIGALVAIGFRSVEYKEQLVKDAPKVLALSILIVVACILIQPDSPLTNNGAMLTVGFSGLALLTGALIVILLTKSESNFARRIFRHPVLTFFGKYSYALYVFHWPITSLFIEYYLKKGYHGFAPWLVFIVGCFSISLILALLSWNLMERPILSLKRHF